MNKRQFYELLKPLIEIYNSIEEDMIIDILERIDNYDGIKGTLKWYIDKLNELKVFERHNTNIANKEKREIKRLLEDILETSCRNSVNLDTLESYNKHYNKNITIDTIYKSTSATNLIKEALKDTESICKLINTKAIEAANQEYQNILNTAYLETSTGIYTYDQSIKRAIDKMAENGILMANYDSGRKIGIESAVRRDIITRVNQLVGDVELETASQLGTNLVYVDQHLGARTRTKYMKRDYEAHDEWQGKVYMIEGSSDKYRNLYEATGYKEMLGLKGLNCYHDLRPFFEWEKMPAPIDIKESKRQREILDKQREYERSIRTLKREKMVAKKMGYEEDYKKSNNKLIKLNREYKGFLESNKLNRNYSREYVYKDTLGGLGSSKQNTIEKHPKPKLLENIDISKKEIVNNTLIKYENIIKDDKIENAIVITTDGEVYQCFGNSTNVWPDIDLGEKIKGSIITHNHPSDKTYYSFSNADISLFEKYELKKLRGIDDKYTYELDSTKKHVLNIPEDYLFNDYGYEHLRAIDYAIKKEIYYNRWDNNG